MEFLANPMGWFIIVVLVAFGLYVAWGQIQQSKGGNGNGNQPCPPPPSAGPNPQVPPAFQPKVPPPPTPPTPTTCEQELEKARRKLAELEAENLKLKEQKSAPKPLKPDEGDRKPKPTEKSPGQEPNNVPSNRRARFLQSMLKQKFDAFRDSNEENKKVQAELWQALKRDNVEFDKVEQNIARVAAFFEEKGWTRGEGRPDDYGLFKELESVVKSAGQARRQEDDEMIVSYAYRWLRDPAQAGVRCQLNEGVELAELAPEVQEFAGVLDTNKVNRPPSLARLLPILIEAEKRLREKDSKVTPPVDPKVEELRKKLDEIAKSAHLRTALTTKKEKFLAAIKAGKDDAEGLKNAISVYRQLRLEPDLGIIPEDEFIQLLEKAFA